MSKMSNLDLVLDEMITAGQKMIDAATMAMANYIQVSNMWNFLRANPRRKATWQRKIMITVTRRATMA